MTLTNTSDELGFWEILLMNPSGDKPEILLGRRLYRTGNR